MARSAGLRRAPPGKDGALAALWAGTFLAALCCAGAEGSGEGCSPPACQKACAETAADVFELLERLPDKLQFLNISVSCRDGARRPPFKGLPDSATDVHLALASGRVSGATAEALGSLVASAGGGGVRRVSLHLDGISVPAAGLRNFTGSLPLGLRQLHVDVSNVKGFDDEAAQSLGTQLQNMSNLERLALHVRATGMTSEGMHALAKSLPVEVEDLDMKLHREFHDTAARALAARLRHMPLRRLALDRPSFVSSVGLSSLLENLPDELEDLELDLGTPAFNDSVAPAFSSRLSSLKLRRLTLLLSDSNMSVGGMEDLAKSLPEQLEDLVLGMASLRSFNDTVAQALGPKLQHMPLRHLNLQVTGTNVSSLGLQKLAKSLPKELKDLELGLYSLSDFNDVTAQAFASGLAQLSLKRLALQLYYSSQNLTARGAGRLLGNLFQLPQRADHGLGPPLHEGAGGS